MKWKNGSREVIKMAETLTTLSIISFAVAGISLIVTIIIWFLFDIQMVIGDLSGRTAKKSVARMRAANEQSGTKSYKESKTNAARGKLTGMMSESNKSRKKKTREENARPETGLLNENKSQAFISEETELLNCDSQGSVSSGKDLQKIVQAIPRKNIKILEEIIIIHTDETIG